ncbi:MAG: hypothetical protein Q7R47_01660 [Candidatus Diapherotrites archaeon]|nr:hypothetical protein [Candidatus Diapherotrites archaeon]
MRMQKQNFPLFFGVDHDDHTIQGRVTGIIGEYGQKARTLFIEGTEKDMALTNKREIPYRFACIKARRIGMNIVFLDEQIRRRTIRTKDARKSMQKPEYWEISEWELFQWGLARERNWFHRIARDGTPNDIVFMHPAHLGRMIEDHPELQGRAVFFSPRVPPPHPFRSQDMIRLKKALRNRFDAKGRKRAIKTRRI